MRAPTKHLGFFDFFPTPKFLSMESVGINLSDESVKFIELIKTPNGTKIGRFGEEVIPSDAILNGVIKDKIAVEKVISGLQKKYGLSFARISIPEEETYLLEIPFPLAPLEVLRKTAETQFEEYVPMKRAESIFDLDVIGVSKKQAIVRVQMSAVSEAIVQTYETVFQHAGITPVSFEAESQALMRAVIQRRESGTTLIVDIGKKETTFVVVHSGSVWITSSVDVGGETITQALSKELSLSFEKAENDKRLYGVSLSPQHKDMTEIILQHLKPIEEKMRQHISYQGDTQALQDKKISIERVIMCGGGSNLPGLTEYLRGNFLIPITLANPWTNSISFDEYIPSISFGESLRYAPAIGLAMQTDKIDIRE